MRLPDTFAGLAFALFLIPLVSSTKPPRNLLIYRDTLLPGRAAAYRDIEEDAARICAEMHCPNHHLAIESLTGATEVCWLFWMARTRAEAERLATVAGGETTVFALRPYWGMPAKEWIAADPEFWKPDPASRLR